MSDALSLAGVGWVPEHPEGNRLRWSWPETAVDGDVHLLPEKLLVERAPLDVDFDQRSARVFGPAANAPPYLWKQWGDVHLSGFMPVSRSFGPSVQAVRFLYQGMPALVYAFNDTSCVATQPVSSGHWAVVQAAAIDLIAITTPFCTLQMLSTLDLYSPPPLPFEVIAEINVGATAGASFGDASTRYPAGPTLNNDKWLEFRNLWNVAWAEVPGAAGADGAPNAWQELQIVLAARWEHAVFAGLGFVDGPDNGAPALDAWGDLLAAPSGCAYRVRDPEGRLDPSNIVCIPGAPALALPMLPKPSLGERTVRLGASGAIHASWNVGWTSPTPGIVGTQVQETLDVGGSISTEVYDARGRRPSDPPGAGSVYREEIVASHEVWVSAAVRAQDGFDRLGPLGPATALLPLALDHHPQPPPLRSATNDGTTAILNQSPPAGWAPDAIVASAGGKIRIHRRIANPERFERSVVQAVPAGEHIAVKLDGAAPADPSAFNGGQITIDTFKGTIVSLGWPVALVSSPSGAGTTAAVVLGATAVISQAPTHPALFTQVHERAAAGLPAAITFVDPLPAASTAQIAEYRAQLAFAGITGPFGAPVQAFRLPATPPVPPPFTVTTLGIDFYHRTVVQLDLTNPTTDRVEIWWADGNVPPADFPHQSVPGDAGTQLAEGGRTLFDTLSLPIPKMVDRTVTIGVQAVNAADGRSGFATVTHTLTAP